VSLLGVLPRLEWADGERRNRRNAVDSAPPVFLLAPHRSFTSVLTSMLGEHPDLYALPETNLFITYNLWQWWLIYDEGEHLDGHGLLRAVAEVVFGEQTIRTVALARRWLRQRLNWPSAAVFAALSARLLPSRVVEKSPWTASRPHYLQHLLACYPDASFLHMVRHPCTQGASLLRLWEEIEVPKAQVGFWLDHGGDPQHMWWRAHSNILQFLEEVSPSRQLLLRGEDALADIDGTLRDLCRWLGITADPAAIDAMKHPERSRFAFPGPPGAVLGLDPGFLADPVLRPRVAPAKPLPSLDDVVPWDDKRTLKPEVRELARKLGYS
jgi:hypothetical protein